jgi:hypothetical protein
MMTSMSIKQVILRHERQHRFPERLAGDGAGCDTDPSDNLPLLHNRSPLPELCRLNRSPLAGRPAADA